MDCFRTTKQIGLDPSFGNQCGREAEFKSCKDGVECVELGRALAEAVLYELIGCNGALDGLGSFISPCTDPGSVCRVW